MFTSKISIIILNWNGKHDTEECLHSLQKINYPNYDVIIVDNGSSDGSVEYLKAKFPETKIIVNKKNYGFAEGNNIGVREALIKGSEYILILNNDTVVDPNLLLELRKVTDSEDDIAIVSPKIYNYYEKNTIEAAGFELKKLQSKIMPIGYGEKDIGQYNYDRQVSFASGCAMFIKTKYITSPIFDPYYFIYCEDMDFCHDMQKKGYKIYYAHKAKIWHKVSASTGGYKSPLCIYLFNKNRFKFAKKNLSFFERTLFYTYMSVYIPAFIMLTIKRKEWQHLKSFIKALLSIYFSKFKNKEFAFDPPYTTIGINARNSQRQITGIERYTLELIKNIAHLDKQNRYVLFLNHHEKILKIVNQYNFQDYVTTIQTRYKFLRIFWEQFWLAYEIKKNNIDLFHGPSFLTPLNKTSKSIITIHDLSFLKYPASFTLENKLYFKIFLRRSIKNAEAIIADSHSTKEDIIHHFNVSSEKVKVIYLGVDEKYKVITDKAKLNYVKTKYALPDKFILFTGVLSPRKNLERTLIAVHSLKNKNITHKFVIVGKKGWLYDTIFEKIKALNLEKEVIFTDYIDENDLPAVYNLADVFILASLYEGFGLPILEAMACGCPVVTSQVSSMPEVAGDAAFLIDPFSTESIANAIEQVIKNEKLRKQLIIKGFERAKMFSWRKTAEETLLVYDSIKNK